MFVKGGWVVASLRFPDTADANRATRSHVTLLAALLLVGEISPLLLSMPRGPGATKAFNFDGAATASNVSVIITEGDGSYARTIHVDETISIQNAGRNIGYLGLGLSAYSIAIVGTLMALYAAGLRRLIGHKVHVSSPWFALRLAGCAVVGAALISSALIRLGMNFAVVWLGIM